jgi:hypothetical protein
MSDPFNYPFLRKDNTMYLSTICTSTSMQPSKTSTRSSSPSTGSHPSCSTISQALRPRCSSPRAQHLPILPCRPTSSPSPIGVGISIRHPIRSSWGISRERGPRPSSLGASEMWILCVRSTLCPLLGRSLRIMVEILFVIPCKSVISMASGATPGRIGERRSCVSLLRGAVHPN